MQQSGDYLHDAHIRHLRWARCVACCRGPVQNGIGFPRLGVTSCSPASGPKPRHRLDGATLRPHQHQHALVRTVAAAGAVCVLRSPHSQGPHCKPRCHSAARVSGHFRVNPTLTFAGRSHPGRPPACPGPASARLRPNQGINCVPSGPKARTADVLHAVGRTGVARQDAECHRCRQLQTRRRSVLGQRPHRRKHANLKVMNALVCTAHAKLGFRPQTSLQPSGPEMRAVGCQWRGASGT